MEYSATQSSVNPPLNVSFGSIVDRLAMTYENVVKAKLESSNPPRNPPPGSFGYSPQSDTKSVVMNPAPGTIPQAPVVNSFVSLWNMLPSWAWIVGAFIVLLMFGGLRLARRG